MCKKLGVFCPELEGIVDSIGVFKGNDISGKVAIIIKVHQRCISGNAKNS